MLRILVLKDKKDKRVCLIPSDVKTLINNKVVVYVQSNAGNAIGYTDNDYLKAGATIVTKINKSFIDKVDIIASVNVNTHKNLFTISNPNVLFWGYQYLVNNPKQLFFMLKNNVSSIGIETINVDSIYEFIIPNEKIKGSYAPVLAANLLCSQNNKYAIGTTINKIDDINKQTEIAIINYSYSGYFAAIQALAMGANVTYIDVDDDMLDELSKDNKIKILTKTFGNSFKTIHYSYENLSEIMKKVNVLIATNQLPTVKTKASVTESMIKSMPKGSVFIDLAVETGFSSNVETKPASLTKQFNHIEGVACVTIENIASLFTKSSSDAISSLNTKYFVDLSKNIDDGIINAISKNKVLANAMMTYRGNLTNINIAKSLSLKFTPFHIAKK